MNVKEIIERIEYADRKLPREDLQTLLDNRKEVTPFLLEVISDPKRVLDKMLLEDNYILPFYSIFMLAQFQENRAYKPIYDLFSFDEERVDAAFGDFITEDLGRVLASVCDGDVLLIKQLFKMRMWPSTSELQLLMLGSVF